MKNIRVYINIVLFLKLPTNKLQLFTRKQKYIKEKFLGGGLIHYST